MTKTILVSAIALAAAAIAGSASAGGVTVAYNVGITNDYVFRGLTQNYDVTSLSEKPAIQGGIDLSEGAFYEGVWASNSSFGSREVDIYGGWKPTLGNYSFDLGAIYYNYDSPGLDTTELKAVVTHPFYKGTIGAAVYDDIDYGNYYYYELNGSYPLTDKLTLSGAVGEQSFSASSKYSTGNIGVTYAITPKYSIDFRYSDTNLPEKTPAQKAANKTARAQFAVLLKATF
jgi:uncharacterized protein (TIGR02001 family)